MKIFPISGHEYKIYPVGHGSIAGMKYAMKLAFIDVMKRTPGIVDIEQTEQAGETVWSTTPSDELEAWGLANQDHPKYEYRIAEAILHPVDERFPFTEEVYLTADPLEMQEALSFFIQSLPGNKPLQETSKRALKRSGTSKAVTK